MRSSESEKGPADFLPQGIVVDLSQSQSQTLPQLPEGKERQRSRAEGFQAAWPVAADYRIADGVLRAEGGPVRIYMPATSPQVMSELAKLNTRDEQAVLAFSQSWGSLGYIQLVESDKALAEEERRRLLENGGDPLAWIQTHADGVHVCLTLIDYLKKADHEGLGRYLSTLRGTLPGVGGSRGGEWSPFVTFGAGYWIARRGFAGDSAPKIARNIIREIVNVNMARLTFKLQEIDATGHFGLGYTFTALIDMLYWHLARLSVGALGMARCQDTTCGAYFVQTDKRQRFCPPDEYLKKKRGGDVESPCANRARVRRFEQERRSKGDGDG